MDYKKFFDEAYKNVEQPSIEAEMITMTASCPDGSVSITRIAPEDFYKMDNFNYDLKKFKEWANKPVFNPASVTDFNHESYAGGYYDGAKIASERAIKIIDTQWSKNYTLSGCLKNQMQVVGELKFYNNEKSKQIDAFRKETEALRRLLEAVTKIEVGKDSPAHAVVEAVKSCVNSGLNQINNKEN